MNVTAPVGPSAPASSDLDDYCEADRFEVTAQGHAFTFYPTGSDRLEALVEHIESAQATVDAFYYLFQPDTAGEKVRDALVEAARRGVKVRLIVDDFGSDAPPEFFEPIVEAGGQFSVFSARKNVRYLIRNHQKFAIVDQKRVMTGGANVSDHYFSPPCDNGWSDLSVAIEGEVVDSFTNWFGQILNWIESDSSELRKLRRMVRQWHPGDGKVQLLVGGPSVSLYGWAHQFRKDLISAKRLDTVSAYFTPQRSLRRLMGKVARRGEARIITAGKSDIDATIAAARLLYKGLLKAGVKIYEFQPSKLHMKLLVIDDFSYFGSANLDKRSIRINVELMVRVEDAGLAARLREMIDHIQDASEPITRKRYKELSGFPARLRWTGAYILAMTDYWLTRRLNR